MINVSQEYITKINSLSKQVGWSGTVSLTNGKTYSFDATNLKQGQSTITRELCDTNSLKIGGACSAELTIAFMLDYDSSTDVYSLNGIAVDKYEFYDATIVLYFRLYFDNNTYEDVPCGTFIVAEPERTRMVLTCTAYDYMQKFSAECVSELQGSPYSLLLNACSVCGVTLGNTPKDILVMPNGSASVAEYDPKNDIKTWRDVICYVASMLCGNAVIKSDNKLYIIPFNTKSVRTISEEDRVSLTLADYITNYLSVTAINARVNIEEKVSADYGGLTYKIGLNPLMQWVASASRRTAMLNILNVLANLDYAPFSGNFFCDPSFELGDVVTFTGNHALTSTKAVITKIVIPINGHMQLSCDGDDPYKQKAEEAASSEYSSETSGSVGDGVTFYDYTNDDDITVASQAEEEIIVIEYESNGVYRQEFAGEIQLRVTTNESLNNGVYTNNDCRVLVTYYRNGEEYLSYHPEESFTDGTHLLHLLLIWDDSIRVPTSTFKVVIQAINGSLEIPAGFANGRIMQSGTAYEDVSNELVYIEVAKDTPYKRHYTPGETIDYTGLIVYAYYEDGSREQVQDDCTLSPVEGTAIADNKSYILVDVTYVKDNKTYTTQFDLDVHYLESIYVKTEPTKTDYFVGETLDLTGIQIYASYSDTKDVEVTDHCTFNPASGASLGTEGSVTINISYTESGVTKTCEETINVQRVQVESLIITPPTKTVYEKGETLDYSGINVIAVYNNGTQADVTNSCEYDPESGDTATTNMSACTVSYTYNATVSDTFDLEVYEFTGINVTTEPTNTSYWLGEVTDYSGIAVSGEYSNGTTEDVTAGCTYNPANGTVTTSVSQNTVTVSYVRPKDGRTYQTQFSIEVKEPEPFLKYVTYDTDSVNRIIYVKNLNTSEIEADGIHNLVIPSSYTDEDSGITYDVKFTGDE